MCWWWQLVLPLRESALSRSLGVWAPQSPPRSDPTTDAIRDHRVAPAQCRRTGVPARRRRQRPDPRCARARSSRTARHCTTKTTRRVRHTSSRCSGHCGASQSHLVVVRAGRDSLRRRWSFDRPPRASPSPGRGARLQWPCCVPQSLASTSRRLGTCKVVPPIAAP